VIVPITGGDSIKTNLLTKEKLQVDVKNICTPLSLDQSHSQSHSQFHGQSHSQFHSQFHSQ